MLRVVDINAPAPDVPNPYAYPLDPFQKWAFDAINKHEHVLVTAKTGSGKTLVGEYQIKVSTERKKRVFYTTPIKSLSNQKFHDLKELGYSVGIMTGDVKFSPHADVVVMTTEILCNLLYRNSDVGVAAALSLDDVDAIVFDEVHYINDPHRGKVWEQCLMLLPRHINLVLLSATIADAPKFAQWLVDIKKTNVHLISTTYRVVPLVHMVGNRVILDATNHFHSDAYKAWLRDLDLLKKKEKEHSEMVASRRRDGYDGGPIERGDTRKFSFLHQMNELIRKMDLPALFFVFSRFKCEKYANLVDSDLLTSSETASVRHILDFHLHRYPHLQTSPQYHSLVSLLQKGVAYHHSGLLPILKEIVEILFSKGFVKVLFATETFAVGINMPTKTVVFTSYSKHTEYGYRLLRTDEYIQMAGRAGRRGKDDKGIVYYLPDGDPATLAEVQQMMLGKQQSVSSKMDFGYDFLVKSLYGHGTDWKEILKTSYWYTQHLEWIGNLTRELKTLQDKQKAIPLQADMISELKTRVELEAAVHTSQNSKKKQAQRNLAQWKEEHSEKRWDMGWTFYEQWESLEFQIQSISGQIEKESDVIPHIEPKVEFLREHKFLDSKLGLLASNIHEGHPLLMSTAFDQKLLHTLDRTNLVGALSVFLEGDGKSVTFDEIKLLSEDGLKSVKQLRTLAEEWKNSEPILSPEGYWDLHPYWVDVSVRWMNGEDMSLICQDYEIYEGNFVRAMLKLSNLLDEWIGMATLMQDLEQLELLRDVRQQIVRGPVVPDSLYLRI